MDPARQHTDGERTQHGAGPSIKHAQYSGHVVDSDETVGSRNEGVQRQSAVQDVPHATAAHVEDAEVTTTSCDAARAASFS